MIYDDPMGEENREDLLRFLENKKVVKRCS